MTHKVLEVKNISKSYKIGELGVKSLFNFSKNKHNASTVYSLNDVSFNVNAGESLGVVGRNGAGKSTLLKILSRITSPSSGTITQNGRIASLLEVGTGFHPELTGRENIFLNGAILGMRKSEIARKFDEVVSFSGVEQYIDTPVKRYSSGMYVRLAFAVAAHLENEILIVDEVLAVGDAAFQQKCLAKMKSIGNDLGRTVIYVSHNIASVKALCTKAILLEKGVLKSYDTVDKVVQLYQGSNAEFNNSAFVNIESNGFLLKRIVLSHSNIGNDNEPLIRDAALVFEFNYFISSVYENPYFNLKLKDLEGNVFLVTTSHELIKLEFQKDAKVKMRIPAGFFNEGNYIIDVMVIEKSSKGYFNIIDEQNVLTFQILPEKRELDSWMGKEPGFIKTRFDWIY